MSTERALGGVPRGIAGSAATTNFTQDWGGLWLPVWDIGCLGLLALTTGKGAAVMAVLVVLAYSGLGLYRDRVTRSVLDELPRLLGGLLGSAAVVAMLAEAVVHHATSSMDLVVLPAAAAIISGRVVGYSLISRYNRRRPGMPALIVGAGGVGAQLGRALVANPQWGIRLAGFVDAAPQPDSAAVAPVIGEPGQLAGLVASHNARYVFVAFSPERDEDLVELLRACDRQSCEIFLVPRLLEMYPLTSDSDHINGIAVVRIRRRAHRTVDWRVKRSFDALTAGFLLVLLAPVLAVCALLVRIETGPGVFFRQTRIGQDGREFDILKFRTLKPETAAESDRLWNIANDHRLGPVGKFLRKASLDELPQLINIVRGDMSLVGPRPERPYFVAQFQDRYRSYNARHRVPAGLTGWAAISGLRGDTSIEERARFDNLYIESWSLWLDVKIIIRTIPSLLRRTGG